MKQDKETGRKKKKKEERYTKNIPKACNRNGITDGPYFDKIEPYTLHNMFIHLKIRGKRACVA